MTITFDPAKRLSNLAKHGIDFWNAEIVFAGDTFVFQDTRQAYGEVRMMSVGHLNGRMVIIGWTPRPAGRHVFTMRKCNDREQKFYGPLI